MNTLDKPAVCNLHTARDDARPLDGTLAKLREQGEWYAASAGPIDDWQGWTRASAYACDDFAAFQPQLDEAMRGPVPDKRLHGYGLFGHYAWLMVISALACYLLDRRVPDLSPDDIAFRRVKHDGGEDLTQLRYLCPRFFCLPSDSAAAHPDAVIVANEAVLRDKFHQQIETYLPPVMQVIQANTGYIQKAMWAQVSDWVILAVMEYTKLAGRCEQMHTLVQQFAKRDGSPLKMRNGVIALHFNDPNTDQACTEYMLDRATCCQWYRFPESQGERCSTCPSLLRTDRMKRMTAHYLAERAKQMRVTSDK
jgi:ferric iron reductase protein FhuF